MSTLFDLAIIGAGISGLTCAQQLQQAGYRVVVLEKSRGAGGRAATRRLTGGLTATRADHGLRYLEAEGDRFAPWVEGLVDRGILQPWAETGYVWQGKPIARSVPPRYVAPNGMNAIGKFLATNLEIWFDRRVQAIAATETGWHLTLDAPNGSLEWPLEVRAKAAIVAIPAPQAQALLATTTDVPITLLDALLGVEYDPCITAIAGYPPARQANLAAWQAVSCPLDSDLLWIGLDSSKRISDSSSQPVFVLHSTAQFAKENLEAEDLKPLGDRLLAQAAEWFYPWMDSPEFVQVHRWRYAFCSRSWPQAYLTGETPWPLVCCGDWCGETRSHQPAEAALRSGSAAASWMHQTGLKAG